MRPRLKENPKEWLKFTLAMSVAFTLLAVLLWRRKQLPESGLVTAIAILGFMDVLCLARPAWFRSFYRAGMTVGYYLGQWVGRILLTALFFLVLTPLGLCLRLAGKDLLKTKARGAASYWQSSKVDEQLDRLF